MATRFDPEVDALPTLDEMAAALVDRTAPRRFVDLAGLDLLLLRAGTMLTGRQLDLERGVGELEHDAARALLQQTDEAARAALAACEKVLRPGNTAGDVFAAGLVCERYKTSKIVAFSSGNVYAFSSVARGGATGSVIGDNQTNGKVLPVFLCQLRYLVLYYCAGYLHLFSVLFVITYCALYNKF